MKESKFHLPPIGMRIMKSSIAVFLCYVVYLLRGRQGIVFYSQLAVLWCIQPYVDTSLKKALQRTVGTLIGALFGLIILLLDYYIFHDAPKYDLLQYALISFFIIPIIYSTVLLNRKDASYFSCVVFLSIVVIHSADANPYLFVWNRVCDTLIGIVIGILVNSARLPRRKRRDLLFISGLDDTLLFDEGKLSAYSKVELNRIISEGANFTVSTMRTPADIIDTMKDVHLKLPVIAMDGAVLFDIDFHKYLRAYTISYPLAKDLIHFIRARGFHCFINTILEDCLVIYHEELGNAAEQQIYRELSRSPYRNYINSKLPEDTPCIYLMLIDETDAVENLYQALEEQRFTERLKILHYPSEDYPGYSYIKIYNRNARRELMMHYLQSSLKCSHTITFGSVEGKYDYTIHPDQPDMVVHQIKKLYEPVIWSRQNHL